MKKFAFAAIFTVAVVSFALGEELTVNITKVDTATNKITYKKGGFKKNDDAPPSEAVTKDVSSSVMVSKGNFKKGDDGPVFEAGDAIKEGLKDEVFAKAGDKGVNARITIAEDGADKGKVTKILVIQFKGNFKGKKDAD
jgi:hypothetical protein